MLFRGIILGSFLEEYARPRAFVYSAALFGLAHMNVYQFAGGFAIGVILAWLYERSRSLWPCIFLHRAYDSLVTWTWSPSVSPPEPDLAEVLVLYWVGAFLVSFVCAAFL